MVITQTAVQLPSPITDASLDWVFLEQTRDHRRIEIGPHSVNGVAIEVANPAVPVVEPQSVVRRRQGMKFHDSPIILHNQMLKDEFSAVRQNFVEFREAPRQEIRF